MTTAIIDQPTTPQGRGRSGPAPLVAPDELFKQRVADLAAGSARVLDYGAGRGVSAIDLRGLCRVTGCDVAPDLARHPYLHDHDVIHPDSPLPYPDATFDLVHSRYVFEHIDRPEWAISEILRVLKPGGHVCASTPTKHGYVALAASLVPNALHTAVLKWAQPDRLPEDTFPTRYKLNTRRDLERHFGGPVKITYGSGEAAYHFGNPLLKRAFEGLHRVLPGPLQTSMFIEYRKPV